MTRGCPPTHRLAGFTLIELVASLVLLSILLVAITGVIPRFTARAQDRTALDEAIVRHAAQQALTRLTADLVTAEAVVFNQTTLQLIPDIECRPDVDDAAQRSTTISYALLRLGDRTCLVRSEPGQRELLFGGEFWLTIQPLADDGTEQEPIVLSGEAHTTEAVEPHARQLTAWTELALRGPTVAAWARTIVAREAVPVDVLEVFETDR